MSAQNSITKKNEEDLQVRRLIWKTLIPNFTAELSLSMTSVVDGAIVGFFYGAKGLAAVGAGGPILSVFTIAAGIIGTGNSVLCSNLIGRSKKEDLEHLLFCSLFHLCKADRSHFCSR